MLSSILLHSIWEGVASLDIPSKICNSSYIAVKSVKSVVLYKPV